MKLPSVCTQHVHTGGQPACMPLCLLQRANHARGKKFATRSYGQPGIASTK